MDFDHYYDANNTPGLNIPPGNIPVRRIPLGIDSDVPFYWRGIKIPMASGLRDLAVRFKDPAGNFLQDALIPAWLFGVPPSSNNLDGGQSCVLESEIECPAGSTVELDVLYNAPQAPSAKVLIAPNAPDNSTGSISASAAPLLYKGNLFELLTSGGTTGMYFSRNKGQSWTLLDAANSVPSQDSAYYWDGLSNLVTVLFLAVNAPGNPVSLRAFNLDTLVWGPDFGGTNAPDAAVFQLVGYPDGVSFIGLFNRFAGEGFTQACIFSADAWGGLIDFTANAQLLPGFDPAHMNFTHPTAVLDSATGILHVMFGSSTVLAPPPQWLNRRFYQQIMPDGSLGVFFDFPGQQQPIQDILTGVSYPAIANGQLVWGILRQSQTPADGKPLYFPAVYVGAPVDNPVWAVSGSIWPEASNPGQLAYQAPQVSFDAHTGNAYAVYPAFLASNGGFNPEGHQGINLAFSRVPNFLTGWSSHAIADNIIGDGHTGIGTPGITLGVNGALLGVAFDAFEPSFDDPDALLNVFWVGFPTLEVILTGVKRYPAGGGAQ